MTTLHFETLEPRDNPAALDIAGGALTFGDAAGEDNALTVSVSGGVYAFKDTATVIALGAGAVAAGWRGDGTHAVSGPEGSVGSIYVDAGGGTNAVNVRSCHVPIVIDGGAGTTTITLNSVAPAVVGTIGTITGPVTVNAGADTTLNASDYAGARHDATPITVTSTEIDNLAATPIYLSGTFTTIHVWGPHGTPPAGYLVLAAPTSDFRLN